VLTALKLRGVRGSIVWGYHTAAALGIWRVSRTRYGQDKKLDTGWRLSADVVRADAFQCARRPLYFTAPHEKGQWCWPVEAITITGRRLSARLRAPEQ
jgi:hypothetical protein